MSLEPALQSYVELPSYREALGLPKEQTEEYTLLAQGEYNRNYRFTHPVTGQELVLRVNYGSQMHLEDQIGYEAHALKLLEPSGRTPKVLYVDGTLNHLDRGVLVMEFLPGHALDYTSGEDLLCAAEILRDIHRVPVPEDHGLVTPENSLKAILEECEAMVAIYMESPLGDPEIKKEIRELLDLGWKRIAGVQEADYRRCIINTELNNTNFLMGEKGYLIDWEKPLFGDPAQDLGHFLAPTTTFWKTDVIFSEDEVEAFLDAYGADDDLRQRTYSFLSITCLRGLTWCAMAWVEYQDPDRPLFNESTFRKLEQYLEPAFLADLRGRLLH